MSPPYYQKTTVNIVNHFNKGPVPALHANLHITLLWVDVIVCREIIVLLVVVTMSIIIVEVLMVAIIKVMDWGMLCKKMRRKVSRKPELDEVTKGFSIYRNVYKY